MRTTDLNMHVMSGFAMDNLYPRVPFTALAKGKALPEPPAVALMGADGGMVLAVEHCFYVVPQKGMTYSSDELQQLGSFMTAQDVLRMKDSAVRGGFARPVALLRKLQKRERAYCNGMRWEYTTPKRTVVKSSLEVLLTQLKHE